EEEVAVEEEEVAVGEEEVVTPESKTQHGLSFEEAEELLSAMKFPPFTEVEHHQITEAEVIESEPVIETPKTPQEPHIMPEMPPNEYIEAKKEKIKDKATEKITTVINKTLEEVLKEFSVPFGYIREFIISENMLYTIVRKEVQLLGVKEERLELQKELSDGSHPVEGYLVRLLVKNGKIQAVEFLRKGSQHNIKDDKTSIGNEEGRNNLLHAMRKEIQELQP
ncbi:MAG: hypothetical protein ACE5R6_11185, partial [Candidatus Heimdallarchaeota archaeon]